MRIALLLPRGWTWPWLDLPGRLARFGEVEVLLVEGFAPSPLLGAWLALERRLTGAVGGAAISAAHLPEERGAPLAGFDLVVDLSGRPGTLDRPGLRLLYDGLPTEAGLWARLVQGGCPVISVEDERGRTLAASYAAVPQRGLLSRAAASSFARAKVLIERSLAHGGDGPLAAEPTLERSARASGDGALLGWIARRAALAVQNRTEPRGALLDPWLIALRRTGQGTGPAGFSALPSPADRFYADPFLLERDGRTWLFAEEYIEAHGRGTIVCGALDDAGGWSPAPALERPYHLSYPNVFEHAGALYLLPETMEAGRVELYLCDRFPDGWRLDRVLIEDVRLVDPTLLQHDGRWWLFGAVSEGGGSSWDELFAYSAPDLHGPWTPHPANPLKSNARSARPAGRFVRRGDRLLRPAQDCETSYGAGLVWCEVTQLTPTTYAERIVDRWSGPDFGAYDGAHTYSEAGGWEAIDLRRARRR